MKKACLLILLTAILVVYTASQQTFGQTPSADGLTPQQAIDYLSRLADEKKKDIQLSEQDKREVAETCAEIVAVQITGLKTSWKEKQAEYQKLIHATDKSLVFIRGNLRSMGEDGSPVDKAYVKAAHLKQSFRAAGAIYSTRLDQMILIKDYCHLHPQGFVAGLEEIRGRQEVLEEQADKLTDFSRGELQKAFWVIQEQLPEIEEQP